MYKEPQITQSLTDKEIHTDANCPAEIKEIKEIFASLICAQPVAKALSVISVNFCVTIIVSFISFISAGLK